MPTNILDKIIEAKRKRLEQGRREVADTEMAQRAAEAIESRPVLSMKRALTAKAPAAVIAEFKRRSPSKGWIAPEGDAASTVAGYYSAGAAAASVLTEEDFFGGSAADLIAAREAAPELPIIRKDFIIDPYQIDEARAIGADAILLIASALSVADAASLAVHAHSVGLEILLELHTPEELAYVKAVNPDMVGVNNRRLADFVTDLAVAESMAAKLPESMVAVAESGVGGPDGVARLQRAGFGAFLVGEYLMRGHSIASLFEN